MVESFYSRARREIRRIAGYVTVSATPLLDKMADQKSAKVTARSFVPHKETFIDLAQFFYFAFCLNSHALKQTNY
jgi:hypothetical protein